MPVYRKEVVATAGISVLTDADLAFGRILDLTRDGSDMVQVWSSVPPVGSNQFIFEPSTGSVEVDPANPFNGGEILIFIYSSASGPTPPPPVPPPFCYNTASATVEAYGELRLKVTMAVPGNYVVEISPNGSACGSPVDAGYIGMGDTYISGVLPAAVPYIACIKVDCGGGNLSPYASFGPATPNPAAPPAGGFANETSSAYLIKITPKFSINDATDLPIGPGQSLNRMHGTAFSGNLKVKVATGGSFEPVFIRLLVNGTLTHCIPAIDGDNLLTSVVYSVSDLVTIILSNTPC